VGEQNYIDAPMAAQHEKPRSVKSKSSIEQIEESKQVEEVKESVLTRQDISDQ